MERMVTDFLGDGVLMYSSDYPHAESRFPESANKVLEWKSLRAEVMRKMMWDNATKCFGGKLCNNPHPRDSARANFELVVCSEFLIHDLAPMCFGHIRDRFALSNINP
jgi:hypothetical protein